VALEHRGVFLGDGMRFAIVVSRTNEVITDRLRAGAVDCLERHGVEPDAVEVYWVPGSFEIPFLAARMAQSGRFAAVITLGAVIRGGTSHFELVSQAVSRGVADAGLTSGVPVILGVITADSLEQAVDRAGAKQGNRGFEAALAALEMANLVQGMERGAGERRTTRAKATRRPGRSAARRPQRGV
jgi:6,7-dimethyl-8-ribityllumazine synthase